jgi:GPH family glycoside/pentoside/hexuronide:cation symporter
MHWPTSLRLDAGKLGWVTGELALASYVGVATIYLLFYATEVLRIPPAWAGFALLIPRIWNIAADPVVGLLSDRTRTRFGRRRPFLLIGALVWGAAFCTLFNLPRGGSPASLALLFAFIFLLNNTGLSLFQVPYSAMLAEFTRDPRERTRLVAYREVAARVAILLTLAGAPLVLAAAATPAAGFGALGIIFGCVILASGLIAFFATAGAPATTATASHGAFTLQIAPIVENRPFAFVTLAFLFVNLGDAVFSGSLVYYVTEVLHRNAAIIGTLYPVGSVTGILSAPLWSIAANRFGKTSMCRVALGFLALCCLLPLLIPANQYWLMYPFMCLYGLFNTGARLLPNAMVPDTVELDEQRTGERREGVIFGLFVFVQQTAFAVGGFVLSVLLALAGVHAGSHDGTRVTGILICFTAAAAVLYGSAFLAILGYRLDLAQPKNTVGVRT